MGLDTFSKIDGSRADIVKEMIDVIRIPAIAPESGGTGESARADHLITRLEGFDSVVRIDVPDDFDPTVKRSNILARKTAERKERSGSSPTWIRFRQETSTTGTPIPSNRR